MSDPAPSWASLPLHCCLLLLLVTSPANAADWDQVEASARAEAAMDGDRARTRIQLITDAEAVAPGAPFRAAVRIEMDPGWHIYWRNSGEAGLATEILWRGPFEVGDHAWPAPSVYDEADGFITTYGYSDEAVFVAEARLGEDFEEETATLVAIADFLVCEVDCIPGRVTLETVLPVGPSARVNEARSAMLERWEQRSPLQAEDVLPWEVDTATSHGEVGHGQPLRAAIALAVCAGPPEDGDACPEVEALERTREAFIPDVDNGVSWSVTETAPHPTAYRGMVLQLQGTTSADTPGYPPRLAGVLRVLVDGELTSIDVEETLAWGEHVPRDPIPLLLADLPDVGDEATASTTPPLGGPTLPWWQALILAFVGGMILNLMPCVFPVLAIKAYGFAHLAHAPRSVLIGQAGAYTGGIVTTMAALAFVVVGLQWTGQAVGWGFQFQEPIYVALVGAVLVLFALNLFGVFEVTLEASALGEKAAKAEGAQRSFFEGVLAVVLATPCSAPFLGTAVGFALASPAWVILLIFVVLGLGLAAPFVALSLLPGARRLLPRPGEWMARVKEVLGLVLLGTTIWLLWILGQSTGVDGMTRLLLFLLAVATGAWLFGLSQRQHGHSRAVGILAALGLLVLSGSWLLRFPEVSSLPSEAGTESVGGITWIAFNEDQILAELEDNRPVFVDFTADWCITCKVNERTVLRTERVRAAIETHDVTMMKADWTRRDDRIREVLARHGKAGVPMYLVYSPAEPDAPQLLPELLTPDMVVDALAAAAR